MANYQLTQTGAEVQALLDTVASPETTQPVAGSSKLITSGAVSAGLAAQGAQLTELEQKVGEINDYQDEDIYGKVVKTTTMVGGVANHMISGLTLRKGYNYVVTASAPVAFTATLYIRFYDKNGTQLYAPTLGTGNLSSIYQWDEATGYEDVYVELMVNGAANTGKEVTISFYEGSNKDYLGIINRVGQTMGDTAAFPRLLGNNGTSNIKAFTTISGHKYRVYITNKADWTINNITPNTNAAWAIEIYNTGTSSWNIAWIHTLNDFSTLPDYADFTAISTQSRIIIRADSGENLYFEVVDLSAPGIRQVVEDMTGAVATLQTQQTTTDGRLDVLEEKAAIVEQQGECWKTLMARKMIADDYPYYFSIDPDTLSTFDTGYLDSKIREVPDGKHFIFVTDTHWGAYDANKDYLTTSAHKSNLLIQYVRNRLHIDDVAFGGDCLEQAPNKYLAAKLLSDYADEFYSMNPNGLWVQGNHDANPFGSTAEEFAAQVIPEDEAYKRTIKNIASRVVFDEEGLDILPQLFSGADLAAAQYYFKKHYYYDNLESKTRYIVVDTGDNGVGNRNLFGINNNTASGSFRAVYLADKFIATALRTTPAGWTIVVLGHQLEASEMGRMNAMFYCYRNKLVNKWWWDGGNVQASVNTEAFLNILFNGSTFIEYDFTQCPANPILFLGGHFHCDYQYYIQRGSIASGNNPTGNTLVYADSTSLQSRLTDEPIVVWRNRDAYGSRLLPSSPYYAYSPEMTLNTITECSFDVVTDTGSGFKFTRFGPGSDLEIPY